jgi:NAD+ kinase
VLHHLKRMCDLVSSTIQEEGRRDLGQKVGGFKPSTRLVDRLAESAIVEYVKTNDLPLNILSEELGYLDRGAERTLVVDPVDGTHNAIRSIPLFATSLAVGTRDLLDVETGLVSNLATGVTYWAERGKGAYRDGVRLRTRRLPETGRMFLAYVGRHSREETDGLLRVASRARSLGCASLEMCLVAEGHADAYIVLSPPEDHGMKVWDIAASYLLLREAGGGAVDGGDGRETLDAPLRPESAMDLVAYGDPAVVGLLDSTATPGATIGRPAPTRPGKPRRRKR